MFSQEDVCAVIISYNDPGAIRRNIESVLNQANRVIIIDNASDKSCVDDLKQLATEYDVFVEFDNCNRGIAFQLNRALRYCVKNGYDLLLTMDQDTRLQEDCVQEMINVLNKSNRIGTIGPNREYPKGCGGRGFLKKNYIITSGSLVDVQKAINAGGYFDDLFIDMVDIDFSLAMRRKGYAVGVATEARMVHQVGEKERNRFLWFDIEYYSHSPKRFYYIFRNRQIVCRKYFRDMPLYCIRMWVNLLVASFHIFLEKNAIVKMKMSTKGFFDGICYNGWKKDAES